MAGEVRIGLAGWTEAVGRFRSFYPLPPDIDRPTGLQRYAHSFDFAEINASFYRRMRRSTFEKWAQDTPADFGFSVKMYRGLTHFHRLKDTSDLEGFIDSIEGLGGKLLAVLVQLPPSLAFDSDIVSSFFVALRRMYAGPVACEPRHASWESSDVAAMLGDLDVGIVRVSIPAVDEPAGPGPVYVRLHGSPRRYFSSYDTEDLQRLAAWLGGHPAHRRFVVFDNTASSAATRNARELRDLIAH